MKATLLDTGPVYALLDRSDTHHAQCAELLAGLSGPRLLPSTVLVEVCWLLEDRPDLEAAFLDSVANGAFELVPITAPDIRRMSELVLRYSDLPLGAVDASVIALAERLDVDHVATLDRRHFRIVRPAHVPALTLLP